jgi:hypothetical protein
MAGSFLVFVIFLVANGVVVGRIVAVLTLVAVLIRAMGDGTDVTDVNDVNGVAVGRFVVVVDRVVVVCVVVVLGWSMTES